MTDLSKRLREIARLYLHDAPSVEAEAIAIADLIDTQARKIEELEQSRQGLMTGVAEILRHETNVSHSDLDNRYDAMAQEARAEAAEAKIEELAKALEPFSAWVEMMEANEARFHHSNFHKWSDEFVLLDTVTLGHFRLARTTLSTIRGEKQ